MKTLKFNFLFCALTALCVMAACSDDDDNAAGGKQSYTCSVTIKTAVNDTTLINDEVYMAALKKENELLQNKLTNVLGLDSLGEFVFQATDTTALKAEVAAKCETALAGLDDSWKGYHQVGVCHFLDEKHPVQIYNKLFGKKGGANSSNSSFSNYPQNENLGKITDLGIYTDWCSKNWLWTVVGGDCQSQDLNSGCGGAYIYLCGWFDGNDAPITDVICLYTESEKAQDYTLMYNGRTYEMVKACADYYTSDCNFGEGGPYLYLMETRDNYEGRYLEFYVTEYGSSKRTEPYTSFYSYFRTVASVDENGNKRNDYADLNEGAGGDYVYLHMWFTPY